MTGRWWQRSGACVLGGCRARWLLAEWCRHCGAQVVRAPGQHGYVHVGSCAVPCGDTPAGGIAQPGAAAPGERAGLAELRHRFTPHWQIHVIPPGYIAIQRDPADTAPVFGLTPGELTWAIHAVEAGRVPGGP